MDVNVIFDGVLLFFLCFAVHVVIWRIRTPWGSSLILLFIFLGLPFGVFLLLLTDVGGMRHALHLDRTGLLEILLLHVSLAGVYISSYPAARAFSPSLDILVMISTSQEKKMREDELASRFSDLRLVDARIDDLKEYRFITEEDGRFVLRPAGRLIARTFMLYRTLLGLPMGGG
jgi:hypothetical protein